jgi:hypothetical protein
MKAKKSGEIERLRSLLVQPWRIHDLRRSFVTGLRSLHVAKHVTEACVNHVSGDKAGISGVYDRSEYMAERREAMERWARHVQQLIDPKVGAAIIDLAAVRIG